LSFISFYDEDRNGVLNKGLFGPSEPWGMSFNGKKVLKWPKFSNISFKVTNDISNILIVVK
jgi:uncharacterized protein (DUF2141 family)